MNVIAKQLKINLNTLEEACLEQPELFYEWANKSRELKDVVQKAKQKRDLIESELTIDVTANVDKYKLPKNTVDIVKACVKTQPSYIEAENNYFEKLNEQKTVDVIVDAINQRKDMLSDLIKLHGQDYFSLPKTMKEQNKYSVVAKARKKADKKLNTKKEV